MSQSTSMTALLGAVSVIAACGSDGAAPGMGRGAGTGGASSAADAEVELPLMPPPCVSGANERLCAPSGFPFAEFAIAISDACPPTSQTCPPPETARRGDTTASLSQTETGTLCVTGTVKPGGWAQLVLNYSKLNQAGTQVLRIFDADALGITQAAFTITSPPSQGLGVIGGMTKMLECGTMNLCSLWGFSLMTAPDLLTPVSITEPGPQRALFANFRQTDPTQGDPSQKFDTRALQFLAFAPGVGSFDFCVRDFRFLDANGMEVTP